MGELRFRRKSVEQESYKLHTENPQTFTLDMCAEVCRRSQHKAPLCGSKKLMAVFTLDNDRTRTVHFGSAGASDYTQHRDPVRKRQYLARHAPREHWENPMTAGALARWILWNKETLPSSIEDYTRRFNLAAV